MKNLIFIIYIVIILFKTGNVLSDNNIFNVNNVEIPKETSKNKEKIVNLAFKIAFKDLSKRLLLEKDQKAISRIELKQIKELISYYQIINPNDKENKNQTLVNVFFDKERMHNFFYNKNILYSDIINTDVIFFPLLKKDNQYFFYSQNFFFNNWKIESLDNIIQYTLPVENLENIEKINSIKNNIYDLDINNFFKEYDIKNKIFATIEIEEKYAKVFLNTIIENNKINKTLNIIREKNLDTTEFNNKIILKINNVVSDLIKSQNLIDVRTPSFLNVEIKMNKKNNLVEFSKRIKKIDLIDNFYVQQLNKNNVLIKIKYLGKINKIIGKLKDQKINLELIRGQWQLNII